ncbi:hypothetical protein DL93DRAFT_2126413 [Clavulina sp. PMI_390]|nr:hypothetical protein DL93DRAFT_2126413 [Clavulina sp. PMI_390]
MVYCQRCGYSVWDWASHLRESRNHYACDDCDVDFTTFSALQGHWRERHYYCQYCNEHFEDEWDHRVHKREEHSYCEPCDKVFWKGGEQGLRGHNRQVHSDRYCVGCERVFQSSHNYQAHMRSSLHRERDIRCPMKGCNMTFVSASAMTLHLDQGACVSGMNRHKVNELVVRYDRNNIITNPNRLLTSSSNSSPVLSVTTWTVTNRAWNGQRWECYLCNRDFRQKNDLEKHLNSPRHEQKIYRCPRSDCQREFPTLSGFMQHVESQSCEAYRFRPVQDVIAGLSTNMRSIRL